MTAYWAAHAWLPSGPADRVRIDVGEGTITSVTVDADSVDAHVLPGIVLPGFANAHSHAFHRALRGRTHGERGDFWTWRQHMYAVAQRLDPDSYLALATAVYAEMALAGVTCVGEFHYVHHQPDGTPYADPNAMGEALREAARRAGVRLTLLDTVYLAGSIGVPLRPEQRRFGDESVAAWAERAMTMKDDATCRVGAAIHSVRAVPREDVPGVVAAAAGRPLHVHLSEQPAENAECLAAYGLTPTQMLARAGALGPATTVVHATHLAPGDVDTLGAARVSACFCPTTERDLADGIGPARELHDAGAALCLGSDQHAVIDLLEEARELELHERLRSGQRGRFPVAALVEALTANGHAALGWPEAGRIEAGVPADLVGVRLDTVRTAGVDPGQAVMAATAADVDTVIAGGRVIVRAGQHVLGDVATSLQGVLRTLWADR